MAKTPEGEVKKDVKTLLKYHECWYFMPVQTGHGRRTIDFHAVRKSDGRFLAIETKAAGKKPTDDQVEILKAILDGGGMAFVYDGQPEDYALLDRWLDYPLSEGAERAMLTRAKSWLRAPKVLASEP